MSRRQRVVRRPDRAARAARPARASRVLGPSIAELVLATWLAVALPAATRAGPPDAPVDLPPSVASTTTGACGEDDLGDSHRNFQAWDPDPPRPSPQRRGGKAAARSGERPTGTCNQKVVAGGEGAEEHVIELGTRSGSFRLERQMFSVADKITVLYEGRVIYSMPCSSGAGSQRLGIDGESSTITVRVRPHCNARQSGDTLWWFIVHCPD